MAKGDDPVRVWDREGAAVDRAGFALPSPQAPAFAASAPPARLPLGPGGEVEEVLVGFR